MFIGEYKLLNVVVIDRIHINLIEKCIKIQSGSYILKKLSAMYRLA